MRWRGRVLACALLSACTPALAHDWYGDLKQPVNGHSCCSDKDCHPARGAYMDDDGTWLAYVNGVLTPVPRDAIINTVAPDAGSHVCIDTFGRIVCFIRGLPKG